MQNRWTWRDRRIRMNSVSPGPVDTPILPDFIASAWIRGTNIACDGGLSTHLMAQVHGF
jgi:NAD(P)-dependent dehydrogenase (short-subunit alcohol dehydrogenase family)